jgi:hypothetical protein
MSGGGGGGGGADAAADGFPADVQGRLGAGACGGGGAAGGGAHAVARRGGGGFACAGYDLLFEGARVVRNFVL